MSDNKGQSSSTSDKDGKEVDEELSELLDSALEDFKKEDTTKTEKKEDTQTTVQTESTGQSSQEWSEDFIQQTAMQFEQNFTALLTGGDGNAQVSPELLQQKLQQMADAAQQVLSNPTQVSDNNDFAQSISQAIQGLSQGAEGLQNPFNEDDLLRILGTPSSGPTQDNELLPFMQGMMQGLLSKEVLGPSLQDFVERLPDYIEKNKEKLAKEDVERYQNQKKLMEEVLTELNMEKDEDTPEVKRERFTKVLGLMQKLQDYGQPPQELVGDVEVPFSFDPSGNPLNMPNLDGSSNPECSIM